MTTKASDNSGNRVTIQSSIEDILGYELALHIFRMLKIEESATKKQAKVDSGDRVVVGVNKFKETSEPKEFTSNMCKLGSVKNTKKFLEDLYKRS